MIRRFFSPVLVRDGSRIFNEFIVGVKSYMEVSIPISNFRYNRLRVDSDCLIKKFKYNTNTRSMIPTSTKSAQLPQTKCCR